MELSSASWCYPKIEQRADEMVEFVSALCRIPAVSPLSGGCGEVERADFVLTRAAEFKPSEVRVLTVADEAVPGGCRKNLVLRWSGAGTEGRRIVFLLHLDTVGAGDRSAWSTDPFTPVRIGDRLYGLGVEDNAQDIASVLYGVPTARESGAAFPCEVVAVLLAGEEEGSAKGVRHLIKEKCFFRQSDMIVVPDGGTPVGDVIEVCEKGRLLVKLTSFGSQHHSARARSKDSAGETCARAAVRLLDVLRSTSNGVDPLFCPPSSTFHVTRHETTDCSVNTVSGRETVFLDCRLIPSEPADKILAAIQHEISSLCTDLGVHIEATTVRNEPATANPDGNPAVLQLLDCSIRQVLGVQPHLRGSGSGSVAAFLRLAGFNAVVWCRKHQMAHMPNEYIDVANLVADAKVFATVVLTAPIC